MPASPGRSIGERIYTLRTDRAPKLTQQSLADLAGVSLDVVSKLEQGRKTSARVDTLTKLAGALAVPVGALIDDEDEQVDAALAPAAVGNRWEALLGTDDRAGRPADAEFVAELRETNQRLVALETLYGGDDVLPLAMRSFRTANAKLAAGQFDAVAERELEAAVGEAGEIAAWIAFDADRQDLSRHLIHEAMLLSRSAGDRDMELLELSHMSMQSLHLARPREALRLADDIIEAGRLAPRVRSLFELRRARSLAQYGDRPRALAAIEAAGSVLDSSIAPNAPMWTWWMDESELYWHRGMVRQELGLHREAVADYARSVELAPRDQGRHSYLGLAFLLDALSRVGAWRDAEPLVADVAARAADVRSGRASRLLLGIAERIKRSPSAGSTLIDHAVGLRRAAAAASSR